MNGRYFAREICPQIHFLSRVFFILLCVLFKYRVVFPLSFVYVLIVATIEFYAQQINEFIYSGKPGNNYAYARHVIMHFSGNQHYYAML